jgi:aspartate aminotransferase
MVKMAQGTPKPIRTSFADQFKMSAEQLREHITPNTKALILCSPSNPTGTCYTLKELKQIAEVLKEHPDILIFSDEIYEYIVFNGEHVSILNAAPELKDRTVVINGFSKGFAMTGWRLGYAAGPKEIIDALAKIQSQETSAPSSISQKAGLAAYTGTMAPVARMRDAFLERRNYMVKALNEIDGVDCFTPSGAFYLFPDIRAFLGRSTPDGTEIKTSTDLCLYLLEEHGVAAVPGDAFGEPGGLRISYASSMEQLKEAILRLTNGFDALN